MNELRKTLAFAGAAVALAILVLVTSPRTPDATVFGDLNRPFYPEFKDPLKVAALEVTDYLENENRARTFKVEIKDGIGRIPSHHNYPADAKDRLNTAATGFIDLRRENIHSQDAGQHADFGVIDPLDAAATGTQGRGQRIVLRDAAGNVLGDYILGKVFGEKKDQRYVRLPGQKPVYSVKAKLEVSTRFSEWIETDLLQLSQGAVRKVDIDSYSFDPDTAESKNRAKYDLVRDESFGPWKVTGMKETEEPHADHISAMMSALDDLKIVGVRPKPAGLVSFLKEHGDIRVDVPFTQQQLRGVQSLPRAGFFPFMRKNQFEFASKEGEVRVSCDDGVIYTLRFGDVAVGSEEEITAGLPEDAPADAQKAKETKPGASENRYLMVTVKFDPALLGAPPAEPKPYAADPAKKPEEQKADEEKAKKDKEEYDRKKQEYDKKLADGKKRAQKLTDRFADWYYVVPEDPFKKIRRPQAELVKPKEAKKEGEHKEGDGHKHDEKKPEPPKAGDAKPEEKKPEPPKSVEPKPDEKKLEPPKPEEKKP